MNLFDLDKQKSFHGHTRKMDPSVVENVDTKSKMWTRNRTQSYVFYKRDNIRPRVNTVRLLDSLGRYSEVGRM